MGRYFFIIVLILCMLFGCNHSFQPTDNYRLIKVIDGDTIYVKSPDGKRFKVRYIGLDCPEKGQPYYYEAVKENRRLLRKGRVRLEFDMQKEDQYGRLLAYVFVDNTMINAELLRLGLARFYNDPHNRNYRDLFLKMEGQARKNHRGIWKEDNK